MVGAGRERAKAPSSSARGLRSSIPDAPLRRALLDSMSTPPGPSSPPRCPAGDEVGREEVGHVVAGEEVG